ncbi:hypothetical protein [Rhizobium bangladeshense]|uniref:hypothetical protein n=1 Tax=Rhizobium bangladeshense TaxID=1138189 RepID=UPI001C84062D|nr:hypothetical protein [Rhizobium bangladeshense]MBX4892102.1 hypothetical protein [Rhizobium bangladeshense]MBX4913953.1 hypothetical protein [Rhizobium bangladeshense]MBX4919745.1 hypothetical protein [Rhizobium bangladeshense]
MSADCVIKAFSGCACPSGQCAEKPFTPAPVTFISWRLQAITCIAFGFLAAILSAAWMERLEKGSRQAACVTVLAYKI